MIASLTIGQRTYVPLSGDLVTRGVVRLPSGIEEYDTIEALFKKIQEFIQEYVELEDTTFLSVCATYVLMTYVHDRFGAIPYLRAIGDYGGGKTRLIETVGNICYRPIFAGGATSAASLFRAVDLCRGTFVMDEGDFGTSEMEETIIKVLTAGYKRGFPLMRVEKDSDGGLGLRVYDAFGPKVLATRGNFKDGALESRCLSHPIAVTATMVDQPFQLPDQFYTEALHLRNKLTLWRFRSRGAIVMDPRQRLYTQDGDPLEPRINEIGLPLLSCAPESAHPTLALALGDYSQVMTDERTLAWEGLIVAALQRRWAHAQSNILIKSLVEMLRQDGDLPSATSRTVASIIRKSLKLKTSTRGGGTPTVIVEGEAGRQNQRTLDRLCRRYGITEPTSET
jgi:hypothetical protein